MRARLVVMLLWLFAHLPLRVSHALGSALGWLAYHWPSEFRDIARINIGLCFPHLSAAEQKTLLYTCLQETGKAVTELGALWHWPVSRLLPLIREVEGAHYIEQGMAAGKGVIVAAPHFGAWEILGVYCTSRWPMTNLYRPPHLEGLDDTLRASRERYGSKIVPTDAGGVRGLMKALKRGEIAGILPDQEPDRDGGVFAPFYGIPAYTMTLLSKLARKSGAAVIFTSAERLPAGQGYRIRFQPASAGIDSEDALQGATSLNQAVERCIQAAPAQYQWAYKRFKSGPNRERRFY